MPNIRIADLRTPIGNIEDAKKVFARIAELEKLIEIRRARLELKVARMKSEHAGETSDLLAELDISGRELVSFISANRALFQEPRKVKTDFGSFGLQTSTEVVIRDEEKVLLFAEREAPELLKITVKPDKPAIKTAIEQGAKIPGAELRTGDTAVYKVAESVLKAARESVSSD